MYLLVFAPTFCFNSCFVKFLYMYASGDVCICVSEFSLLPLHLKKKFLNIAYCCLLLLGD